MNKFEQWAIVIARALGNALNLNACARQIGVPYNTLSPAVQAIRAPGLDAASLPRARLDAMNKSVHPSAPRSK